MEITGHTQFATFIRYVNVDTDAARHAAALLDRLNEQEKSKEKPTTKSKRAKRVSNQVSQATTENPSTVKD